ncbi:MAG: cytochrome C oxidase subunit IV family protein [Phycisphaerales bacterium]|jgi:cytochrome c oxidase subunit 4|nr:cytochrome C oxidase subunit IV family protein [Phycisphaerales bacterium]
MTTLPTDGGHDDHGVGHVVSIKLLVTVCAMLLVLTVVTILAVQLDFTEANMPEMNIIVAMGIACVKATIVGLIFMHLLWDRPFIGFIFVGSILFVVLFVALAMTDTMEYQESIIPGNTPKVQQAIDELH